jgi:carbon storage regulator CsrA
LRFTRGFYDEKKLAKEMIDIMSGKYVTQVCLMDNVNLHKNDVDLYQAIFLAQAKDQSKHNTNYTLYPPNVISRLNVVTYQLMPIKRLNNKASFKLSVFYQGWQWLLMQQHHLAHDYLCMFIRLVKKLYKRKQANCKKAGEKNMLILQRRPGQSIQIGENIQITILRNSNGSTHVGIKAPTNIKILREELQPHNLELGYERNFTKTYSA